MDFSRTWTTKLPNIFSKPYFNLLDPLRKKGFKKFENFDESLKKAKKHQLKKDAHAEK